MFTSECRQLFQLTRYIAGNLDIVSSTDLNKTYKGSSGLKRHPARKLFFLSTIFFFSTVIGRFFLIHKCLFVELRHRMIKSRLFLVRNCLLAEFDSIVGSKLIYQSVWRALRMKRQIVSSDMKSKRMIKNGGPLERALICQILCLRIGEKKWHLDENI